MGDFTALPHRPFNAAFPCGKAERYPAAERRSEVVSKRFFIPHKTKKRPPDGSRFLIKQLLHLSDKRICKEHIEHELIQQHEHAQYGGVYAEAHKALFTDKLQHEADGKIAA